MYKFSEKLRKETIEHFAKEHDHHIDDETADLYLESFARLFLAFTDKNNK